MPAKKKADLPQYVAPKAVDLADVVEVLEMLARQSGVGEIKEKVEALQAKLKG